jgi:uncharacterized protein (TIGR02217 family)
MAHLEILFPTDISYGVRGGPAWNTSVIRRSSGSVQSIQRWSMPLWEFPDVSFHARQEGRIDEVYRFWLTVGKGMANTFLFKDWADFKVSASEGILGTTGVGTGYPTYQLYKKYELEAETLLRAIKKPKAGSSTIYRGVNPVTEGASAGNMTYDTATGIVTFVADTTKAVNANSTKAITGITQANPGSVTCVGHGFSTGDKIKIVSVGGMTQVNNTYYTITVTGADTFTIGVNTAGYSAYTSGGSAIKYGITQTNPVRVNADAHGFTNGQVIYLNGAGGMTEVNGIAFTITNVATNYFELSGINGTSYTAYTGSASAYKYPQPSESLTFTCSEFYLKARFQADFIGREIIAPNVQGYQQIPIAEDR